MPSMRGAPGAAYQPAPTDPATVDAEARARLNAQRPGSGNYETPQPVPGAPGQALNQIGSGAQDAYNVASGIIGPNHANLDPLKQAQSTDMATATALGGERSAMGTPQLNTANQEQIRRSQLTQLGSLNDAAAGRVPSAAEIQLKQQSGIDAARQYALAKSFRGGSAGGQLRMATTGAADVNAATNQQAAALRAQEQAQARGMLAQQLTNVRGQDQSVAKDQAGLSQAQWEALLAGQLNSQGQATQAAGGYATASAADADSRNKYKGGLIGGAGQMLAFVSDRREKTDVKRADLAKLAASLKGYEFRYKDEANGPGNRVGFMAQDALLGGPAGKAMVKEGADGKLRVDASNAIGAAVAMAAEALRRAAA